MLRRELASSRPPVSRRRALGVLLLHASVLWAACAATIGIGRAVTSLETTLVAHAAAAPVLAAAVSVLYFRRPDRLPPLVAACVVLAWIAVVDLFLVALTIERSLDMFRSVLGTWLPFALIFAATAATGWAMGAARRRSGGIPRP